MASMEPASPIPSGGKLEMRDKIALFWDPPITQVKPAVRQLLERYADIRSDDVLDKIHEVREILWETYPWPCVGEFRFLEVKIHELPSYPRVVEAVKSGATFLDVGSCFGQDLRKLVADVADASSEKAPENNLYVIEKEQGFLDAAFDFFGDRNHPPGVFITGDVLDTSNPDLQALRGTVDIIHISLVLHIWAWDDQVKVCRRLVELLKQVRGVMVIGRLVGRLSASPCTMFNGDEIYKHDPESFERLWDEVGELTGTKWKVTAYIDGILGTQNDTMPHYDDPDTRRMMFEVERI